MELIVYLIFVILVVIIGLSVYRLSEEVEGILSSIRNIKEVIESLDRAKMLNDELFTVGEKARKTLDENVTKSLVAINKTVKESETTVKKAEIKYVELAKAVELLRADLNKAEEGIVELKNTKADKRTRTKKAEQ